MTQTSGAVGQTGEVKQSEDAKQQSTLMDRMQRLVPFISSTWLLSILVGVIALGFNLYRLGSPSIWFDEAFSVELARQPLPLLWHIIWGPEPNMELYYLFLHFWLGLTGFLVCIQQNLSCVFPLRSLLHSVQLWSFFWGVVS